MQDTATIDRVVAALSGKRYYKHRFEEQVAALYPQSTGTVEHVGIRLFVSELTTALPEGDRAKALGTLVRRAVNEWSECPTVAEFRSAFVDAALGVHKLNFRTLYERAKHFLAAPPTNQAIADRWIEQIIWTAVKLVTRERFADISPADWELAVIRVVTRDGVKPISYEAKAEASQPAFTKHDFRSLLLRHD